VRDLDRRRLEHVLPVGCQRHAWKRLFSLSEDGAYLRSFFHAARGEERTLLVVKDTRHVESAPADSPPHTIFCRVCSV
jgi:hypothetical protein